MAQFVWGDVQQDVLAMSAPKIEELHDYCQLLIFLSEMSRKYWGALPGVVDAEDVSRLACLKFKKFGFKFQLDYVGGKYVLNSGKGPTRRPPRLRRAAQQAGQKVRRAKRAASERLMLTAGALSSSFHASVAVLKAGGGILMLMPDLAAHLVEQVVQTARRVLPLLRQMTDVPDYVQNHGATLEQRWFGHTTGLNLVLYTFASGDTPPVDWDAFPFGEPPAESELMSA